MISQTTATPQTTSHSKLGSWLISMGWALGSMHGVALLAPPPQCHSRKKDKNDLDRGRLGQPTGAETGAAAIKIA